MSVVLGLAIGLAPAYAAEPTGLSSLQAAASAGKPRPAIAKADKKVGGKKTSAKKTARTAGKKATAKKRVASSGHKSVTHPRTRTSKGQHAPKMARATRPAARSAAHRTHSALPSAAPMTRAAAQRRAKGADFTGQPSLVTASAAPGIVASSAAQADAQGKRQLREMIGREEESIRRELAGQGRLGASTL